MGAEGGGGGGGDRKWVLGVVVVVAVGGRSRTNGQSVIPGGRKMGRRRGDLMGRGKRKCAYVLLLSPLPFDTVLRGGGGGGGSIHSPQCHAVMTRYYCAACAPCSPLYFGEGSWGEGESLAQEKSDHRPPSSSSPP